LKGLTNGFNRSIADHGNLEMRYKIINHCYLPLWSQMG